MKRFISLVLNNPYKVAITFLILSFFSTISILNNLSINTSTNSLIDNNLQFKKNQKKLKDNFKVLNNNVLVRIKGNNSNNVNLTYQSIIKRIESREEFNFFYSPNFDKFFQENFFFMLNDEQKSDFINQLYEFQPFLSEMNNNPKLEGFNNFIELLIENKMFDELENLTYVFKNFLKSLENNKNVDWKGILKQDLNEIYILISVDQNYLDKNGFDQTYNFFGEIVKNFSSENLDIEFTGGLVLDYEEIGSVSSGVLFSGFLSLLLVAVILFAALKELRLILSLILSIIIGLIITTGITSLTVGSLNLISVAFAVLFIGLSVDFGIQIFLRILENNNKKKIFLNLS